MQNRFYITTPIYYVNDVPHLGTAYTTVVTDALRRAHLLFGDETRMLTGTDEHGLKIERAAVEQSMTPQAFVTEMSGRFSQAWPQLLVEADDFIRTTEKRHVERVQDIWCKVEKSGDLYLGTYEDWYCVGCESFKTEKELIPPNLCALHQKPVEKVKEETYFFRLSKYAKPLLDLYEKKPSFVEPESRRHEVVSFVKGGLKDLSVSRTSFTWGIPVPGNPKHVMYVWFDALVNYYSALGPDGDKLHRFWPPNGYAVHLVGKDILRFHAVYWPAFLLAAGFGEAGLPSQVFAHGFLTVDGQKMSKSLRNAVDPLRIAHELGPDALRYYLLRAIALGQDGDFDHAALIERYNADLGKNLGNLVNRVLGLCSKMTDSKVPATGGALQGLEQVLLDKAREVFDLTERAWRDMAPHRALEATFSLCDAANQYVDRAAPWAEAKNGNRERVQTILAVLLGVLEKLSVLIWPAMPRKSDDMRAKLGCAPLKPNGNRLWPKEFVSLTVGGSLTAGEPLFPTFDKDAERELLDKLVPKIEAASENAAAPKSPPHAPEVATTNITYEKFVSIDLRVGVIQACERVPRKDKLLRLTVDLGEAKPRTIIAGLALSFTPDELTGKRVIVVANLAPREFGKGLVSEGMLLAAGPSEKLVLATMTGEVSPGAKLR